MDYVANDTFSKRSRKNFAFELVNYYHQFYWLEGVGLFVF